MEDQNEPTFPTRNTAVAMALLAAGVPHPEIVQCFTDDFLRKHGARDLFDARDRVIPELQRRGIHGLVTYVFQHTPALNELLRHYNDQMRRMEAGQTVPLEKIEPEEAARLAATIQHNKNAILHNLRELPPMVSIKR